jgi:DNA-directed RNA polymerase subunit RPC12/RpoP
MPTLKNAKNKDICPYCGNIRAFYSNEKYDNVYGYICIRCREFVPPQKENYFQKRERMLKEQVINFLKEKGSL